MAKLYASIASAPTSTAPVRPSAVGRWRAVGAVFLVLCLCTAAAALTPSPTVTELIATPTFTPTFTPTACGVSTPVVDPVTSPTDLLQQTISGMARVTGARHLSISSEAGSFSFDCDSTPPVCGLSFAVPIPLLPGLNHLSVCDVNANTCGGESAVCTTVDRNGAPLIIDAQAPPETPTPTATPTRTSSPCPTGTLPACSIGNSVECDPDPCNGCHCAPCPACPPGQAFSPCAPCFACSCVAAQGSVFVGNGGGPPSSQVSLPLRLSLASEVRLATLDVKLTVRAIDSAPPPNVPMMFSAASTFPAPDAVSVESNEVLRLTWSTPFNPPLHDAVELGALSVPIPAGAQIGSPGDRYEVSVVVVEAKDDSGAPLPIAILAGEALTLASAVHCSLLYHGHVTDDAQAPVAGANVCVAQGTLCVQSDAAGNYDGLCYPGSSSAGSRPCAGKAGYGDACGDVTTPDGTRRQVDFILVGATPTPTLTATHTATSTPTSNRPTPRAVVTAAPNPARSGELVTLDGSQSTGPIASYRWTQTCGGPKLTLSGESSAVATFVAPAVDRATTFTFTLTLTSFGATSGAQASIDVQVLPLADVTPAPRPQRFAYVTDAGLCSVAVVDLAANAVSTNIRVGENPNIVALTPDGRQAYVTTSSDTAVIDTATGTVVSRIATDSPYGVAIAPDGRTAYVTSTGSSSINVIDVATATMTSRIGLLGIAADPLRIAITTDGTWAYVTTPGFPEAQSVSVIDTVSSMLSSVILFPRFSFPEAIALSKNGQLAVVANSSSNSVALLSTVTNMITATVPVGNTPLGVAITPDNRFAYVASRDDDAVSVLELATQATVGLVPIDSPVAVAIAADGLTAYAGSYLSGSVAVIDVASTSIRATIPIGSHPIGIALGPACAGDCNSDQSVTIEDLVRMVQIAPQDVPLDTCFVADTDGDERIGFNEIRRALDNALAQCVLPVR